ncbi:MAG: tRNA lysidine(34) synthetase TilS, partial [Acidobacteria bacterium]|nr:tRNA lysidine(34) synthetase TilS [Acidobacteriota bacterium]
GEADVQTHAKRRKLSLETAAREIRHAFFLTCAAAHRCPVLFLAHHADDQVETCLFNFLRGAGAAGLGGMKPVSRIGHLQIVRPLLGVTRAQITEYVRARRIAFREDSSNRNPGHTRNRLRNDVIPRIEATFGPSFRNAILRTAEILREEEAWMDSLVPRVGEELSCRELRAMPTALRRRTVLHWLRQHQVEEPGFAETERVLSMLHATGTAKINLHGNLHARRKTGRIFLSLS